MKFLDNLPLASIISLAAVVIVVVAYISNDLTVDQALKALGYSVGGVGVLGIARAASNKGVR